MNGGCFDGNVAARMVGYVEHVAEIRRILK
jgi:hypothetical protein